MVVSQCAGGLRPRPLDGWTAGGAPYADLGRCTAAILLPSARRAHFLRLHSAGLECLRIVVAV